MKEKVYAIIGAGPSGLACAKVFSDLGIRFQGFESSATVGGLWNITNPNSALYPSVHLISSRRKTEFKHFPMDNVQEDYPHHSKALDYLSDYAEHFGLINKFEFNVLVESVRRQKSGGWKLKLDNGNAYLFDGVIVATGVSSVPYFPSIDGDYTGAIRHSAEVKSLDPFKGERTLVIGAGNSGCDLACDFAQLNGKVGLSMRKGNQVIPKYLLGKPADEASFGGFLPVRLRQWLHEKFLNIVVGDLRKFKLPLPEHRLYEKHPIISSQLLYQLGHGTIDIHPEVVMFKGKNVHFSDGTSKEYDSIVMATGFKLSYPFLEREYLNWNEDGPRLYLNMFTKYHSELFIMGMVSSLGLGWNGRYRQALLIGSYLNAKRNGRKSADEFEELMKTVPDLSGGYNYVKSGNTSHYVNNRTYLRLINKGIELLNG